METLINQPTKSSDDDSPAAAASPPTWVIVNRHGISTEHSTGHGDVRTTSASSFTSSGRPFRISFDLSPPPANSILQYDWAGFPPQEDELHRAPEIVASHGNCFLIELMAPHTRDTGGNFVDCFLYELGLGLLRLLPHCYFGRLYDRFRARDRERPDYNEEDYFYDQHWKWIDDEEWCIQTTTTTARYLMKEETGVLRRGEDEVVVAQIDMPPRQRKAARTARGGALRAPRRRRRRRLGAQARAHRLPRRRVDDIGQREGLQDWWETDVAVPVGDRFLCFVDYFRGFLLYDTSAADTLRYVPLPVEVPSGNPDTDDYGRPKMETCRNLADGAGGQSTVRFVSVEPRCCCGGRGRSTCDKSRLAFMVTTWTLTLPATDGETTRWVKDSVLDCDELWALPGYGGSLPRVALDWPIIVSSDNPDLVWFILRDFESRNKDEWMLEVDTVSKLLKSVVLYSTLVDISRTGVYRSSFHAANYVPPRKMGCCLFGK